MNETHYEVLDSGASGICRLVKFSGAVPKVPIPTVLPKGADRKGFVLHIGARFWRALEGEPAQRALDIGCQADYGADWDEPDYYQPGDDYYWARIDGVEVANVLLIWDDDKPPARRRGKHYPNITHYFFPDEPVTYPPNSGIEHLPPAEFGMKRHRLDVEDCEWAE